MVKSIVGKEYKTISEMCSYLEREKRIFDISAHSDLLKKRTYVSVINPYKKIFASGEDVNRVHIYNSEISVLEYSKLVNIDDIFSVKYHKIIGDFERKLKLEITNSMSNRMFNLGDVFCVDYASQFLRITQSSTPEKEMMPYGMLDLVSEYKKNGVLGVSKKTIQKRIGLLNKLALTATSQIPSKNNLLLHYQRNYPIVSFWLNAQILTFGEAVVLFNMLSVEDRKEITKGMTFKGSASYRDTISFSNHLQRINALRNVINHYEPAFPFFCNYANYQELISSFSILSLYDTNFLNLAVEKFDTVMYKNNYNKSIIESLERFMSLI